MHVNFKADSFLSWIQVISMDTFELRKFLCLDEQTIGCNGLAMKIASGLPKSVVQDEVKNKK